MSCWPPLDDLKVHTVRARRDSFLKYTAVNQVTIDNALLSKAIDLATANVANGQRPFGALLVDGEEIVTQAVNEAARSNDPTDHAEIVAIRHATSLLNADCLDALTLYASCEPCCMCASAILWAGVRRVVFALAREDAHEYGFHDVVGPEISRRLLSAISVTQVRSLDRAAREPFEAWKLRNASDS